MELKRAAAVCLISLFSATLVVLIARALDRQVESRLETKLEKIADELRAIRGQEVRRTGPAAGTSASSADNRLVVYYFHSNFRCPDCKALEAQAAQLVHTDFREQADCGGILWEVVNYDEPLGAVLAQQFEIIAPVVVLARRQGGQIKDWRRLDRVLALVNDKRAFAEYVGGEIRTMLAGRTQAAPEPSK